MDFSVFLRRGLDEIDATIDNSLVQLAAKADPVCVSCVEDVPWSQNQIQSSQNHAVGKTEMEIYAEYNSTSICNMALMALRSPDADVRTHYLSEVKNYRAWWKREARGNMDEVVRIQKAKYDNMFR